MTNMVSNFSEFCGEVVRCGFSMGGGSAKGIYSIVPYTWEQQDLLDTPVKWHTGDPETDPWEWRMRVLEERRDIAYSKVFFNVSGFISAEWYPRFLAVRRGGETFDEAFGRGAVSRMAKRAYDVIREIDSLAFHEIKSLAFIIREENSQFEQALTELQMKMFITIDGRAQKVNKYGIPYGWSSTSFSTVESFWRRRGVELEEMDPEKSYELIYRRVLELNPEAEKSRIERFIRG